MKKQGVVMFMLCLPLLAILVPNLYGQEKKEPPHRQFAMPDDSTLKKSEGSLPTIDLPEFIITGNESTNLPEASKNSTEDHWNSDPSLRNPGPGVREPSFTQTSAVQKERAGLSRLTKDFSGKAQFGYGSYSTPYFDAWLGNWLSSVDLLLKTGYRSSGGHVENADYRAGYASFTGGTQLGEDLGIFSGNRLNGEIGMRGNSYRLYGSVTPTMERTITSFDGGFTMNSTNVETTPYTARFAAQSTTLRDASKTTETSLGLEFSGNKNIDDFELRGDVALWPSFYSSESADVDPYYTQFAGSAAYRIASSLDIRGGFTFYLFRGSDTRTSGRLYPRLGVSWYVDQWLTVYAKFEPAVQRNSLAAIIESSPYVIADVPLRHAEQFTNFSLGAEAELSHMIRSRLSLNHTQTDNTPIYVDPNSTKKWDVSYAGTTTVFAVTGEAYADITDMDNLGASFSVRSCKNSQTGKQNPYFASFLAAATYQHRFIFGLTIVSTLRITGRQSTDLDESRHLPPFGVFSVNADYLILPRWKAGVILDNLFDQNQTWWEGYTGVPRTVSFGTSFAW